jgi:hypothetical protein
LPANPPYHPAYAILPVEEGFNWSSHFGGACLDQLYLVVFRRLDRLPGGENTPA